MKKVMKRAISLLLVLLLALSCLAGCTSSTEDEPAAGSPAVSSPGVNSPEAGEPERTKIGMIQHGKDDALGSAIYNNLNYAAEALNIDLSWVIGSMDPNDQITDAQNLIAAGVQGIMMIPLTDSAAYKINQLCNDAGVYFMVMHRYISDEEMEAEMLESEYYLGCCYEDEIVSGEYLVQALIESGAEQLAVQFAPPGSASNDNKNLGFRQAIEKNDMTLATEIVAGEYSPTMGAEMIENTVASYPNVDGVLFVSAVMGIGESAMTAIARLGRNDGSLKFACFDTFEGMPEAFNAGTLICVAGGHYSDSVMSFIVLANAVQGTPLTTEKVDLTSNYFFLKSEEDALAYADLLGAADSYIYSAEDIQQLCKFYNPNVTISDIENALAAYSLSDIQSRMGR